MIDSRTLYLVSAEQSGHGFWKVGTTKHENPLNENKADFLECYRKELIGIEAGLAIEEAIKINIFNIMLLCKEDGFLLEKPSQGFSYDLPLTLLEEIFDFWFEMYKYSDVWDKYIRLLKCRSKLSFSNQFIINGLIGNTAKYATKIEYLHSYRPVLEDKYNRHNDPMWI